MVLKDKMINLFDLSAQMAGTKLLSDKAHRDVSPVRRKSDVKRDRDPSPIHSDEKLVSSDLARNNSSKKVNTNGTPMKTLLAKEMSKESEPKRNSSNVIAKLMGLDETDLSTRQPVNSTDNFTKMQGPIRKNYRQNYSRHSFDETIEYKDVYEVYQDERLQNGRIYRDERSQNGRIYRDERLQNGGIMFEDEKLQSSRIYRNERLQNGRIFDDETERLQNGRIYMDQMSRNVGMFEDQRLQNGRIYRDQRLQNGRIFRDQRLQNGRMDLVREKFIEAKRLATDQDLQSKEFEDALEVLSSNQDLFLKFLEEPNSLFSNPRAKKITVLKPLKSVQNNHNLREIKRERRPLRSESFSQPTRIVVLKPTCVKIGEKTGFLGNFDSRHRRDESLISSICSNGSNGYRGDESSLCDKSDNGSNGSIIEQEGEINDEFTDSEITSPISCNSRDNFANVAKFGSPSFLSFSRASNSPESSVIKEAKKRLSERWQMVTSSDDVSAEPVSVPVLVPVPRCSSTLGEMLNKEGQTGQTGQKGERDFKGLVRSQSVPVSSSLFDDLNLGLKSNLNVNLDLNKGDKDSGGGGSSSSSNNNKGKSLGFKGKVSSFFFSRSKKSEKEKKARTDSKAPAQHSDEVSKCVANNSDTQVDENKGNLSIEKPNLSICSNDIYEKPKPSPTSVLELQFDDTNFTESESSQISNFTSQQPPLSRSSVIESISRTLSWDEKSFESPINPQIREKEQFNFVQNLISICGFEIEMNQNVLLRFHSLDSPLDPSLIEKFLDRKTEEAKCRERRSDQRLLFDSVNLAILQIGHSNLKNYYPWDKMQFSVLNVKDGFLIEGIWRVVRDWISRERKLVFEERENPSLVVERIVNGDFEGKEWEEFKWLERCEFIREIEGEILDELVKEALDDYL